MYKMSAREEEAYEICKDRRTREGDEVGEAYI